MSTGYPPLSDMERGVDARRECLADLHKVLDTQPLQGSRDFLTKWGEDLRDLLIEFPDSDGDGEY